MLQVAPVIVSDKNLQPVKVVSDMLLQYCNTVVNPNQMFLSNTQNPILTHISVDVGSFAFPGVTRNRLCTHPFVLRVLLNRS